jgi:uncharacterized protein
MAQLPRLAQSVLDPAARVHYAIEGRVDDEGHPGALMRLSGVLSLRCERCNEPFAFALQRAVPFRFVRDEQELNAIPIEDDETEEVVGSSTMELLPWIEDEAILSLPIVPRHADCALPAEVDADAGTAGGVHPFAGLARLKRGDGGGPAGG